MLEESLKRRLEILRERARKLASKRSSPGGDRPRRGRLFGGQRTEGPSKRRGAPGTLEELLQGETLYGPWGECYSLSKTAKPSGAGVLQVLGESSSLATLFGTSKVEREGRFCFLDIETAGLAPNTYLFLCGTMLPGPESYRIEQLFARDYSEEKALLFEVSKLLSVVDYVVTYNGLSFDVPFIRTRMAVHMVPFEGRFTVLDLLYPTRKAFSPMLPDCRLETVEEHLRGEPRYYDIAGRDIPAAYHEFVACQDADLVAPILEHNRRDLLAMELLLHRLTGP